MKSVLTRTQALELLCKYNKEPFHRIHGLTVEGTMRWYARELGYGEDEEFWGQVGLLHDIDFELYPEQHCVKAPEHEMEKVLFAADELTGLIGAAAKMRPSKSVMDMEVSSLKKKFKDKKFAAGCSRDVIKQGAEQLGWTLEELMEKTILAMRSCENSVQVEMETLV